MKTFTIKDQHIVDGALKDGLYQVKDVEKVRDEKTHRKFFGMIKYMFTAWPENDEAKPFSEHDCRMEIQFRAGYYKIVVIGGRRTVKYKSISYASIGEEEFQRLHHRCVDECIKILGLETNEQISSFREFIDRFAIKNIF